MQLVISDCGQPTTQHPSLSDFYAQNNTNSFFNLVTSRVSNGDM